MCGIAGRILALPGLIGADLVELIQAQRHRGADSTGFGMYGEPRIDGYVVRVVADRRALSSHLDTFLDIARSHGADFVEDPTWDDAATDHVSVRLVLSDPASPFERWLADADFIDGFEMQSVGRSLEIIKDLGDGYEVAEKHGIRDFVGTHGLTNARMATESFVSPTASHPFWARPYPDVAIVHNGQLTNYYLLRDRLRRAGYTFKTDNDSELIAIWLSDQMAHGLTIEQSLTDSVTKLDGCFTYILATIDSMAFAKDPFAIKPLVAVEEADGTMAVATEEQAVRKIYVDDADLAGKAMVNYDGPSLTGVWPVPARTAAIAGAGVGA